MKDRGFSLIELLIVVAILGVISAIAVPIMAKARMAAYEANAIRFMRSWGPGQEMYKRVHGFYASTDEELVSEKFINKSLKDGVADDTAYIYSIDSDRRDSNGAPNTTQWWGRAVRRSQYFAMHSYYTDQSGVIRRREGSNVYSTDPPID